MDAFVISPEGSLLNYSYYEIIINSLVSISIGFVLSAIYRITHKGLSYSQSFCHTIVFVSLIVALVMMVVGGSLARAFALVGAMSIIRFRTVLKDTKDLSYVFASLCLGMAAGTGNYFIAVYGTLLVCGLAVFLHSTNFAAVYKSEFILRFRFAQDGETSGYLNALKDLCKRSSLLHVEPSGDDRSLSLTYDVSLREEHSSKDLINAINQLEGASEVILIASKNDVDY